MTSNCSNGYPCGSKYNKSYKPRCGHKPDPAPDSSISDVLAGIGGTIGHVRK
jgi:hypothetical protein